MSANSDPLGESLRVVLPTPGRPKPTTEPAAVDASPAVQPQLSIGELLDDFAVSDGDLPYLVAAAMPILHLAHTLRSTLLEPSIDELRERTFQEMHHYEAKLSRQGIIREHAQIAHYVICATLDDIVRSKPWGKDWAVSGLVSQLHDDVQGGEKVFELLERLIVNPGGNRDVLLLMYFSLSIGFEGKTRVDPRGPMELEKTRSGLYRTLRTQFGVVEWDLSPKWQGEQARHKPISRGRWLMAMLGLLVVTSAIGITAATQMLNTRSDKLIAGMASLTSSDEPSLFIPEPAISDPVPKLEKKEASPPKPPPGPDALARFKGLLAVEEAAGLVYLVRKDNAVLVRVNNSGTFASGSAELSDAAEELFNRIGVALSSEDLDVKIFGYTDDRAYTGAGGNQALSKNRADAVQNIIQTYVPLTNIQTEGRAETNPIGNNETENGREANRRTEIFVLKPGTRIPRDLLTAPAGPPAPGRAEPGDEE